MRRNRKPVRKCHKCPLNQGDHCWGFRYPRDQWHEKRCLAFGSEVAHEMFLEWQKDSAVKTRRQIRQEAFPKHKSLRDGAKLEGKKRLLR